MPGVALGFVTFGAGREFLGVFRRAVRLGSDRGFPGVHRGDALHGTPRDPRSLASRRKARTEDESAHA